MSAPVFDPEAKMREVAARVAERTERGACPGCGEPFPAPPAPAVCERCERVLALPPWRHWPPELRAWLIAKWLERRLEGYDSAQTPWEQLLRATFTSTRLGPDGRRWPIAATATELYPIAAQLARAWAGSEAHARLVALITSPQPEEGPTDGERTAGQ